MSENPLVADVKPLEKPQDGIQAVDFAVDAQAPQPVKDAAKSAQRGAGRVPDFGTAQDAVVNTAVTGSTYDDQNYYKDATGKEA